MEYARAKASINNVEAPSIFGLSLSLIIFDPLSLENGRIKFYKNRLRGLCPAATIGITAFFYCCRISGFIASVFWWFWFATLLSHFVVIAARFRAVTAAFLLDQGRAFIGTKIGFFLIFIAAIIIFYIIVIIFFLFR
jgi:hypothetical protein